MDLFVSAYSYYSLTIGKKKTDVMHLPALSVLYCELSILVKGEGVVVPGKHTV